MLSEEAFRIQKELERLGLPSDPPSIPYEPWQLSQLARMAKFDVVRLQSLLNELWRKHPTLFEELAISAVEQGELSVQQAAERLGASEHEVEYRVDLDREAHWTLGQSQIVESSRGATIEDAHVCVWEIVREYRRLGSVERLATSFPGLTTGQLAAALSYAREHPQEIENAIQDYETARSKTRQDLSKSTESA